MPVKLLKTDGEEQLIIERRFYAKRHSLLLTKARCVGCGICVVGCPQEAIVIAKGNKGRNAQGSSLCVSIDEQKCHYCGICLCLCLFGALEMRINGEVTVPVIETGTFPQLIRDITIDADKCEESCVDCEEDCPFHVIKIRFKHRNVDLNIDKAHCVCCRICELKCPHDAIFVRKMVHGRLTIHAAKCPAGCHICVDSCPIPGTLILTEDGTVQVNEFTCIYCGVCEMGCPAPSALELQRTSIRHTPVRSGAWNKVLEKLTSPKALGKELRIKSALKSREALKKRLH